MTVPAFEEYEPAIDCPCAGCAQERRARARAYALSVRAGMHPSVHGARRALVLATAAGVVLGGGGGVVGAAASAPGGPEPGSPVTVLDPEPETDTPQGGQGPLHGRPDTGPAGTPAELRKTTRADIINRAKRWVDAKVPYSMTSYWADGYRQDCSGYVSMAWNLAGNEWTGSLAQYGVRLDHKDLQPGDILLFHNPADPGKGSHVTIFGGWTDYTHTYYIAYEQAKPHTRRQATPMAYWSNSDRYVAYRYRGLISAVATADGSGGGTVTAYPDARYFGPGANNKYVTQLGRMLVERGAKRYHTKAPGPRWSEADRRATQAFQRAQGWKGKEADGLPGPDTWRLLVNGTGKNIPRAAQAQTSARVPAYPGRAYFRPGQANVHVEELGRQLVKRGFGKHYTTGPDRWWTEADRRSVEAFQRAQGWRGGAADGYPGPETWRRLFS
ncbi:peptidoglycan-binding protein [Streptomyces sp. NPDC059909]|uniref:peptidoglycan-binding protein n=1 Tax=Streptomyces sp. NPDC059909 TaxID=3346998 RepID=UPI003654CCE3